MSTIIAVLAGLAVSLFLLIRVTMLANERDKAEAEVVRLTGLLADSEEGRAGGEDRREDVITMLKTRIQELEAEVARRRKPGDARRRLGRLFGGGGS